MVQNLGVTETDYPSALWLGSHPPISMDGDLIDGQTLSDGTVLGKITASGLLTQHAPAAADGSQNAMGILMGNLAASGANEPCIYLAHGEANGDQLVWAAGITGPQKATAIEALQGLGIFVKTNS